MTLTKSQRIVVGGVIFTLGVLSITAWYIPSQVMNRSDDELRERRRYIASHTRGGGGSMWKQMDSNLKSKADEILDNENEIDPSEEKKS
jgi:hypothetical protein